MSNPIVATTWGRGVIVALVLVVGALGVCCGFDGDNHDDEGSLPDLCLTALGMSSTPALLSELLLQGWAAESVTVPVHSAWTTVLTPPPRGL